MSNMIDKVLIRRNGYYQLYINNQFHAKLNFYEVSFMLKLHREGRL